MSKYRFRAYHKDSNHNEVVRDINRLGFEVWDMSVYGFPVDLYLIKNGKSAWVEIKDGKKRKSKRKLTDECKRFKEFLERNGSELFTVESTEAALELCRNLLRSVEEPINGVQH